MRAVVRIDLEISCSIMLSESIMDQCGIVFYNLLRVIASVDLMDIDSVCLILLFPLWNHTKGHFLDRLKNDVWCY